LQSVLGEMKNVARNNAFLNVRLATNERVSSSSAGTAKTFNAAVAGNDQRRSSVHTRITERTQP